MDPGSLAFTTNEPRIQLYLLLGLVYYVVTPLLLPFILFFFAFACMVYSHQVGYTTSQSGSKFWSIILCLSHCLQVTHCFCPLVARLLMSMIRNESAAAFWPRVHMRVIIGLIVSQFLVIGLFSTLDVLFSTYILIPQPVLTFWFHRVCKGRFEPAFVKFPLQARMNFLVRVTLVIRLLLV
ncbi:putative calcium-dependent channel, 7TM region phosphate [Rosa chinensis]|uniref:Putative calcium-dependent channel, 7TM region phosphate n=1 Tax=Rosa chinensis TaxID=74649 RepID=A0A2P6QSZ7_ROSCH|nr:putative calcium-dependent channel, 7TM region phosphate [Rosa chinensis]